MISLLLLLTACGGGGPPAQSTTPRSELTGVVTDGAGTRELSITAAGVVGPQRSVLVSSERYSVSLVQLAAPYYLINTPSPGGDPSYTVMTSVATRAGPANVTPLTTLLAAQLIGLDSANGFFNFAGRKTPTHLITDANIQIAQAKVTAFLQDYGVQVQTGSASWVESPFNPGDVHDPMYATILALNSQLASNGTTLAALTTKIANVARVCIAERIAITINGHAGDFCPRIKKVSQDSVDNTILDYTFTTIANDLLTVQVRGNNVLSVKYNPTGGVPFSGCTAAGCADLALGAPASDQKRSMTFGHLQLTGSAGTVILDGALIGGNFPPILNCLDDAFFLTLPDSSVVADCVKTDTGPVAIPGTLSSVAGVTRDKYTFANSNQSPEPPQPTSPQVEVVLDNDNSTIVSIAFQMVDLNTGNPIYFACQSSACNGVTLGPRTEQTKFGITFKLRNITMDSTQLSGINPDGTPTGTTATLNASFSSIFFRQSPVAYPPLTTCDPGRVSISMTAAPGTTFNACYNPPLLISDLGGGDTAIGFQDFNAGVQIDLKLHNGVPTSVNVHVQNTGEDFGCATDCTGIVLSPPDSLGAYNITFGGTVLHGVQSFPLPGDHTLTLTGGPIAASPPQPVVCDPAFEDTVVVDLDGNSINMCFMRDPPAGILYDIGGGDLEPNFTSSAGDNIDMIVHSDGSVDYIFIFVASSPFTNGGSFMCIATDCTGFVLSPPDGNGVRTLTFSGAVLPDMNDPSHLLTVTGGPIRAAPQ